MVMGKLCDLWFLIWGKIKPKIIIILILTIIVHQYKFRRFNISPPSIGIKFNYHLSHSIMSFKFVDFCLNKNFVKTRVCLSQSVNSTKKTTQNFFHCAPFRSVSVFSACRSGVFFQFFFPCFLFFQTKLIKTIKN